MYNLYNHVKPGHYFICGFFLVGVLGMIAVFVNQIVNYTVDGTIVIPVIFAAFFGFVFVLLVKAGPHDSYGKFKKLYENNPVKLAEIESDYNLSSEIGHKIHKGLHYYFFEGVDFFVIPIGQITSITVGDHYKRRVGTYKKCIFTSADGDVEVTLLDVVQTKDESMRVLNQLAAENGISITPEKKD